MAGITIRVFDKVILVKIFGFPKCDGSGYLGHHFTGPNARGIDIGNRVQRGQALGVITVIDR